jgi:predicted DNA-binding ArsR family transcriptional regulator
MKLGTTTNLLLGYDSDWLTQEKGMNALFPVEKEALNKFEPPSSKEKGLWAASPIISFHSDAKSLLSSLLPYSTLNSSTEEHIPVLPAGELFLSDSKKSIAIKKISETLGVDLSNIENSFVLVKVSREDETQSHPLHNNGHLKYSNEILFNKSYGITKEYRKSNAPFIRGKNKKSNFTPLQVTIEEGKQYLQNFYKLGTHFVSKKTLGDTIFQIFAMPNGKFKDVQSTFNPEKETRNFYLYTSSSDNGKFGYVSQYGHILNFSQSDALKQSLKNRKWLDKDYAKKNSIFALYQYNPNSITIQNLNANFKAQDILQITLTPLSTLNGDHSREAISNRVLKGAISQKYRNQIKVNFATTSPWKNLVKEFNDEELSGFVSTIATPNINTYKSYLDLSKLAFVQSENNKKLTVFSNYICSTSKDLVSIPGDDIIIASQVFEMESNSTVPVISITDKAFDNFTITADQFFGALSITNSSKTKYYTIIDGIKIESNETEYLIVTDSVFSPITKDSSIIRITDSIQYSQSFAESEVDTLYFLQNGTEESIVEATKRKITFFNYYWKWILKLIPTKLISESDNKEELFALRLKALGYITIKKTKTIGAFVPLITEKTLDKSLNSILDTIKLIDSKIREYSASIDAQKTQKEIHTSSKTINENIQNTAKTLHDYFATLIAFQKDISNSYDTLSAQEKSDLYIVEKNIVEYRRNLNSKRLEIQNDVTTYHFKFEEQKHDDEMNASKNIISNLFKSGASIASGKPDAKEIIGLAKNIQLLVNTLESTNKLYEKQDAKLVEIEKATKAFDNVADTINTNFAWDTLFQTFESAVNSDTHHGVDVVKAKDKMKEDFKTFIRIGKALVLFLEKQQQINRSLYNRSLEKRIAEKQEKRLSDLNKNVVTKKISDIDVSKVDLIGLTGQLNQTRSQLMNMLTKAFTKKDLLLQYNNLKKPTYIPSFNIMGLHSAMIQQNADNETALTKLKSSNTKEYTINYELNIPKSRLEDGKVFEHAINFDEKAKDNNLLFPFTTVRVKAVLIKVLSGIAKPNAINKDDKRYQIDLAYQGRPFYDKNLGGRKLVYNTIKRNDHYRYYLDNTPIFNGSGEAWSKDKTSITPFSVWEISIPKVTKNNSINKGLEFTETLINVELTFKVEVHEFEEQ